MDFVMGAQRPVPTYDCSSDYPSDGRMHRSELDRSLNRQQAGFYRRWQNAWKRDEALDIEGHIDYVRRYIHQKMWEVPKGLLYLK